MRNEGEDVKITHPVVSNTLSSTPICMEGLGPNVPVSWIFTINVSDSCSVDRRVTAKSSAEIIKKESLQMNFVKNFHIFMLLN